MRRKRGIADAVLWPQESEENELLSLYQDILSKDEDVPSGGQLKIADRPDLAAREISPNVLRVSSVTGGRSVIVAQNVKIDAISNLAVDNDAAIIVMGATGQAPLPCSKPTSLLPDGRLWPEYVLPE
jgi:nucleotide-binding universal stress UspA family protein